MSLFPELERLRLQKINLEDELRFLCEREKALEEIVKTLEEKLKAQELARPVFQQTPLKWNVSPEKFLELYRK